MVESAFTEHWSLEAHLCPCTHRSVRVVRAELQRPSCPPHDSTCRRAGSRCSKQGGRDRGLALYRIARVVQIYVSQGQWHCRSSPYKRTLSPRRFPIPVTTKAHGCATGRPMPRAISSSMTASPRRPCGRALAALQRQRARDSNTFSTLCAVRLDIAWIPLNSPISTTSSMLEL